MPVREGDVERVLARPPLSERQLERRIHRQQLFAE
jgi:hypothetical protein